MTPTTSEKSPMKIELRKVHYSKRLSQETAAFAADIYVDGKKRGDVRNDGGGGEDLIHPYELRKEIDAYAKTLPPIHAYGVELPMCADLLLGELLDAHLAAKDMKRAMKGKILFVSTDGKLYSTTATTPPADAAQVLNTMAHDEALALFMKASK